MMASLEGDTAAAQQPNNPVVGLHKLWHYPGPAGKKSIDQKAWKSPMKEWVNLIVSMPNCKSVYTQIATQCDCCANLFFTEPELEEIASYLVEFAVLSPSAKKKVVTEWMRYAFAGRQQFGGRMPNGDRVFLFPGTDTTFICPNAIAALLGHRRESWSTLVNHVRKGKAIVHGLVGRPSNRTNPFQGMTLRSFFQDLVQLGTPRATRVVARSLVNGNMEFELRDDDETLVDLPSHMTKFGLFHRYLKENGWKHVYDAKGRLLEKVRITTNAFDDEHVASWKAFRDYWKAHYPNIQIQRPGADICGECYICATQIRSQQKDPLAFLDQEVCLPVAEAVDDDSDEENQIVERERMIEKASEHVRRAQAQRELFNSAKKSARDTASLPHAERVFCFVVDYSQNMCLPNFAGEQPGETHYYSPLNAYVLGIVDASIDKLSAHTHYEYDGKKGGNNVASFLLKELHSKGIKAGTMAKEIIFVFDNCSGQNKNKMVIRFVVTLVHLGHAHDITMIFLERGHTKNDCDRMFNLMKKTHRKSNVHTPRQLEDHINTNPKVECVPFRQGEFFDFDKCQAKYFVSQLPKILDKHVLHCSATNPDILNLRVGRDDPVESSNVIKKAFRNDSSWATTMAQELEPLSALGLQDIKWIELCDKWRPLVPLEHQSEFKYFACNPGEDLRSKVKAHGKASKKQRKERTRTITSEERKRTATSKATKKSKK